MDSPTCQQQCPLDACLLPEGGRHDEGFEEVGTEIAVGDFPKPAGDSGVKTFRLRNPATDDDTGRGNDREKSQDAVGEIPGFGFPGRMIGRQIRGGLSPTGQDGRAAGEAFQAIAMKGADAGKGITGSLRDLEMAKLRVQRPMDQRSPGENASPDAGANGDVGGIGGSLRRTEGGFGPERDVDIGVQTDRHSGQRGLKLSHQRIIRPARLRCAQNTAVVRARGIHADRPEGPDADGGRTPSIGQPGDGPIERFIRRARGKTQFLQNSAIRESCRNDGLGPAEFQSGDDGRGMEAHGGCTQAIPKTNPSPPPPFAPCGNQHFPVILGKVFFRLQPMRLTTFLSFALLASIRAAQPDSEIIASGLHDPMEISVAPDGDVFVIEREGRVLRVRPSTGGVFEIGAIPVTALREADSKTNWAREDGLLGLTLDPAFAKNQRLYLYYSDPVKLLNRLSRFTLKDGRIDPASEKMLLEIPTDRRDKVCHHGGSLTFGPGGLLYLSTGDNTNPFESGGYAPIDDRDGREHTNAMRSAGNTNDLRGKVLRIRPTEDGYQIPEGNLFPPGTAKTRPEIYVMGCRNPFRISVDPRKGVLYWGEVGPDAGEASDHGPRGHDEVNQAKKAGNFGWPFVIADNKPYAIVDFATGKPGVMTDPTAPKNPSSHNTGIVDLPPANKAFIWYPYAASEEFPVMGSGGRNAMAGPVFYYDASRKWNLLDQADDHTLLTYDWMRSGIWKAKLGDNEELVKLEPYVSGLKHPMDLETDADGNVWLLEYGSEWYFNKDGAIRRLRPATGEKPPSISVAAVSGNAGTYQATSSGEATINWWITEGSSERMIGSGPQVTLPKAEASELRAVATDRKGRVAVARVALLQAKEEPALVLTLKGNPAALAFGASLDFEVGSTTPPDATQVSVRARYIPPTGHDAGGPQFSADQEKFISSKQCLACHQVDKASVGPKYVDVAMKYRDQPDAIARLTAKLRTGGSGVWGQVPMPPQAAVNPAEAETIIKSILGLAEGISETRGQLTGTLKLPPAPASAQPGGAWEISVEAPGHLPARQRLQAR